MKYQRLLSAIGAIASLAACGGGDSGEVGNVFTPAADNTIFEDLDDTSNGAGDYIFVGNTDRNGVRRALIRFDLSALPADATVVSAATMTLDFDKVRRTSAFDGTLHRVTTGWGEGSSDAPMEEGGGDDATDGDATWSAAVYPDSAWTTPGGDFEPTASATTAVGETGSYDWTGSGMVADINDWIQNPADNFGWILIGDEAGSRTASRASSREGPTPPVLTLTFAEE